MPHRPPTLIVSEGLIDGLLGNNTYHQIHEKFDAIHMGGKEDFHLEKKEYKGMTVYIIYDIVNELVTLTSIRPVSESESSES